MLHMSRVTSEPIRLKLVNTGDFGGSNPVQDSYAMTIKGSYEVMKPLIHILKKHGFRWNSRAKHWHLDATLYLYGNRRSEAAWTKARKNQKAAYKILKPIVEAHNKEVRSQNKNPLPDAKELFRSIKSDRRLIERLQKYDIHTILEWPDLYSVEESKMWVMGSTYEIKDIMKKYGFRWGTHEKGRGWWIPAVEYHAIVKKWVTEVIRALPDLSETQYRAVFSEMSHGDLAKFVKELTSKDMYANEHYDGELSAKDVFRSYMKRLPAKTPKAQQEFYDLYVSGRMFP